MVPSYHLHPMSYRLKSFHRESQWVSFQFISIACCYAFIHVHFIYIGTISSIVASKYGLNPRTVMVGGTTDSNAGELERVFTLHLLLSLYTYHVQKYILSDYLTFYLFMFTSFLCCGWGKTTIRTSCNIFREHSGAEAVVVVICRGCYKGRI